MYYAKCYTAVPEIGWLTPGETLSEEQVNKLGEEKLAGMIARGVIAAGGEEAKPAETQAEPETGTEAAAPDGEPENAAEDETDELPELEISGDIVGEPESEPEEAPKKKGRSRK